MQVSKVPAMISCSLFFKMRKHCQMGDLFGRGCGGTLFNRPNPTKLERSGDFVGSG